MANARARAGAKAAETVVEAEMVASRDFDAVYADIKKLITDGSMPAGSAVSQLELTRRLGVSRTPIREALRRLQAEGLLDGERNRRMRVTSITPGELDAIYSTRIFLESMAVQLSVPRMSDADLRDLQAASQAIDWSCVVSDPQRHDRHLAHFKLMAMKYAGEGVRRAVAEQFNRCERVRQMYQVSAANIAFARDEHKALLDAYLRKSADDAVFVASRHLGRTALAVIGFVAPDYEPRAIRYALARVSAQGDVCASSVLSVVGEGPVAARRKSASSKGVIGE